MLSGDGVGGGGGGEANATMGLLDVIFIHKIGTHPSNMVDTPPTAVNQTNNVNKNLKYNCKKDEKKKHADLFIFLFKIERRNNYYLSLPTRPLLSGCGGSRPPDPARNTFINSKR